MLFGGHKSIESFFCLPRHLQHHTHKHLFEQILIVLYIEFTVPRNSSHLKFWFVAEFLSNLAECVLSWQGVPPTSVLL